MPRRKRTLGAAIMITPKRGRKSRLSTFTVADLQIELQRRNAMLEGLMAQRARISEQLRQIDQQIAANGGAVPLNSAPFGRPRRGRPPGASRTMGAASPAHGRRGPGRPRGGLVAALHKVLTGTQMSVVEVCEAVKRAGYQTTSPNFRTIVNAALLSNSTMFKKVQRGVYTAK